jgi:ribonuclease PH
MPMEAQQMPTYLVTFEDDVAIEVDADSEEEAIDKAEENVIMWSEPLDLISIELLTEERKQERLRINQSIDKMIDKMAKDRGL